MRLGIRSRAHRARVVTFVFVNLLVNVQSPAVAKRLQTHGAVFVFFFSVYNQVISNFYCGHKPFSTNATFMWLFAGMQSDVPTHIATLRKAFTAYVALIPVHKGS